MNIKELKEQTKAYLDICYPSLDDSSPLVEECFDNALISFTEDFICRFRPESWARITLTYHKHFLETGVDITVGEIFSIVIRDSINNNRIDFLTQSLAQQKAYQQKGDTAPKSNKPSLTLVKPEK